MVRLMFRFLILQGGDFHHSLDEICPHKNLKLVKICMEPGFGRIMSFFLGGGGKSSKTFLPRSTAGLYRHAFQINKLQEKIK